MSDRRIGHTATGQIVYAVITRLTDVQIWNTDTSAFEVFNATNWGDYAITMTEQGASGRYVFQFPAAIGEGVYDIEFRLQAGGSPAQGDDVIDAGVAEWDGDAFVEEQGLKGTHRWDNNDGLTQDITIDDVPA